MVGDACMLSEMRTISPMAIALHNGAYTAAREQGLATLGDKMKLENVLYMPGLKCNLVSIFKLCK